VGIGTDGDVSFYSSNHSDLVVDVEGFTSAAGLDTGVGLYDPIASPARICDTRPGNPSHLSSPPDNQCNGTANAGKTLSPGGTITVQVTGGNGIPTGATAAIFNVTAVNTATPGYLTVYPADTATPFASNVNYLTEQVSANRVIVPLSAGGAITVYSSAKADVIVDVSGYYTAAGGTGSLFHAEGAPARICDTRSSSPENQCSGVTIGAGETLTLSGVSIASIPVPDEGSTAIVINLTGVAPTAPTYLTVFPAPPRPFVSDLNPAPGQVVANLVVATLSSSGTISIYNSGGSINVVVDVLGWYQEEAT
jgi:hypothetical protein